MTIEQDLRQRICPFIDGTVAGLLSLGHSEYADQAKKDGEELIKWIIELLEEKNRELKIIKSCASGEFDDWIDATLDEIEKEVSQMPDIEHLRVIWKKQSEDARECK